LQVRFLELFAFYGLTYVLSPFFFYNGICSTVTCITGIQLIQFRGKKQIYHCEVNCFRKKLNIVADKLHGFVSLYLIRSAGLSFC
jgi:hypothetical protein